MILSNNSKVLKSTHNDSKPIYSFYKSIQTGNKECKECKEYKECKDSKDSKPDSDDIENNSDNSDNDCDNVNESIEYNNNYSNPENIIIKENINIFMQKEDALTQYENKSGTNNSEFFKNSTPWVEKYRPSCFEDIVLDPLNKILLKNIIDNNYFPNLLFYGPPGTGKTTTIINLVNVYQEKMNLKNKGLMIHLNASDERGIDIIRNQINSFVNSKSLFGDGMKFVILDEVDYMTKTAQIALRYRSEEHTSELQSH